MHHQKTHDSIPGSGSNANVNVNANVDTNSTSTSDAIQAIHQRALRAARSYCQAEAELIDVLIAVETQRIYRELGFSSLYTYCVESLRLSEATAYNAIGVARKAREVPELKLEIKSGELSISKAKKILPVLNPSNSSSWIEKAKSLNSRQLEKEVAAVSPRAATPERAQYVSRERLALSLGLSEAAMLQFRRAQDQVSQSKSRPVSLEETLQEVLAFYLKHKDPVEKARRLIAKKGNQELGKKKSEGGGDACASSELVTGPVAREHQDADSGPRDELVKGLVARTPIPASILHQVRLRDGGRCQFRRKLGDGKTPQICGERRWVEIHHVIPVNRGGRNMVSNLLTVCRGHHQLIHQRHHQSRAIRGERADS